MCDCRFKHLKIKEIKFEYTENVPIFIYQLLDYIPPRKLSYALNEAVRWVFCKLGLMRLYDASIVLEDGMCCSAVYCCDPPDHEWKHEEC